jgi:hypothetical protein
MLWPARRFPIWYLEATLFVGTFVLWAFVFAWHTAYTGRPVFSLRIKSGLLAIAVAMGFAAALTLHFFVDPTLRLQTPTDYPANFEQWMAKTLFDLAFLQLFLIFAPFAWLVRLFRNPKIALVLTVAFGVAVLALKVHSSPTPVPASLLASLLVTRILGGFLVLWFYLRGGILLVWTYAFLIEARHLLSLQIGF